MEPFDCGVFDRSVHPLDLPDAPLMAGSPLSVAVAERDRNTITMVHDAIAQKQIQLAFQPVVQAARPSNAAFYEGLVRVLDHTGRVIPAREFTGMVETSETGRQIDCLCRSKCPLGPSATRAGRKH